MLDPREDGICVEREKSPATYYGNRLCKDCFNLRKREEDREGVPRINEMKDRKQRDTRVLPHQYSEET